MAAARCTNLDDSPHHSPNSPDSAHDSSEPYHFGSGTSRPSHHWHCSDAPDYESNGECVDQGERLGEFIGDAAGAAGAAVAGFGAAMVESPPCIYSACVPLRSKPGGETSLF